MVMLVQVTGTRVGTTVAVMLRTTVKRVPPRAMATLKDHWAGAGPRLDARPLLGEPEPTVRAVEAVSSPDHTVATGRRGSVAANVLLIDVNASGPWGAEDTAFSGAFGANVRSGAVPGLKLLAPDAHGTQALGLKVCLPTGQASGGGEACDGDVAAISGDPVTKISSPGPAT